MLKSLQPKLADTTILARLIEHTKIKSFLTVFSDGCTEDVAMET